MRILVVVHQPDAGLGVFARVLGSRDEEVEEWRPDLSRDPPHDPAGYDAAVVLGGAMHVDQEDEHPWLAPEKRFLGALLEEEVPMLGVCLGAQLVAELAGGRASPVAEPELGWHGVELTAEGRDDPLLSAIPPRCTAFAWHSYEISPPPRASALARSACCLQAFPAGERAWGVQFHAEVTYETIADWVEKDGEDGDLGKAGLYPTALMAETERRIGESERLGAALCERFLDLASAR